MSQVIDMFRGESHHYTLTLQSVSHLNPGKTVFIKWRRSLRQMGSTGTTTVGPDGVANFELPITIDATFHKSKPGGTNFRSKVVTFSLKEKPESRAGVLLSLNPTVAKGSFDLVEFLEASTKPVSIELDPRPKNDAVDTEGQRPVLNIVLSAKQLERGGHHEE